MAENSRTSIILPAYVPSDELHDVTERCLRSLEATTDRDAYQLVVVDNGCRASASTLLYGAADVYVRKPEPIGYARAVNIGLALTDCDWLCVVNTDIEFTQDGWLRRLRLDYDATPGGILSPADTELEGVVYDQAWFACWLTRCEVIRHVGIFDDRLAYRFHDQDFAIRVKLAGFEVMRDGDVRVDHIDSATYSTMGRDNDPEEEELMVFRWGARDFAEWLTNS